MKKLASFITILLLCACSATAQSNRLLPALDTNLNASVQYLSTGLVNGNNGNNVFQYVGTKISGTVAGVVKLQGSLDGVNYLQVGTDSLALTDVSVNTKVWDVTATKRLYYRLVITTTGGSLSLQNKGYYINRRID